MNKYPIYIPSRGRAYNPLSAKMFLQEGINFKIVVEKPERAEYAKVIPEDNILVLPDKYTNLNYGASPCRNFIWRHAIAGGHEKHWQFDDNIRTFYRYRAGKRTRCEALPAIECLEDFSDRYKNLALSSFNYKMFVIRNRAESIINTKMFSGILINHAADYQWRLPFNSDSDLTLQVLSSRYWCTLQLNSYLIDKQTSMTMRGGNTERYKGDGRKVMAQTLADAWPEYVTVVQKYGRYQHFVKNNYRHLFNQNLIRIGKNNKE